MEGGFVDDGAHERVAAPRMLTSGFLKAKSWPLEPARIPRKAMDQKEYYPPQEYSLPWNPFKYFPNIEPTHLPKLD